MFATGEVVFMSLSKTVEILIWLSHMPMAISMQMRKTNTRQKDKWNGCYCISSTYNRSDFSSFLRLKCNISILLGTHIWIDRFILNITKNPAAATSRWFYLIPANGRLIRMCCWAFVFHLDDNINQPNTHSLTFTFNSGLLSSITYS